MTKAQYPILDYFAAGLFLALALWMVIRLLSRIEQVPLDLMTQQAKHGITVFGILALYALARCIVCLLSAWSIVSENGVGMKATIAIMAPTLLFLGLQTRFIRKWSVHVKELKMVVSRGSEAFTAGQILINISFSLIICCAVIVIIYAALFWSPSIYHGWEGRDMPCPSPGNNSNLTQIAGGVNLNFSVNCSSGGIDPIMNPDEDGKIHLALSDADLGRVLQGFVGFCYLLNGSFILFLGFKMKYISERSGGSSYVDSIKWALNRLLIIAFLFGSCCAARGFIKLLLLDVFLHPNGSIAQLESSQYATTIILLVEWLAVTFSLAIMTYTPNVKRLQNNSPHQTDDGPYGRNNGGSGRDQEQVAAPDGYQSEGSGNGAATKGNHQRQLALGTQGANNINSNSGATSGEGSRGSSNSVHSGNNNRKLSTRPSTGSNPANQRSFGLSIEETLFGDSLPGAANYHPDVDFYKPKNLLTSCDYNGEDDEEGTGAQSGGDSFGTKAQAAASAAAATDSNKRECEPLLPTIGRTATGSTSNRNHWRNSYHNNNYNNQNPHSHNTASDTQQGSHYYISSSTHHSGLADPTSSPTGASVSPPYTVSKNSGLTIQQTNNAILPARFADGSSGREKHLGSPLRTPSGAGLTVNKK